MKVILMVRSAEVLGTAAEELRTMFRLLDEDYMCRVYAENARDPHLPYLDRREAEQWLADPSVLAVCYWDSFWEKGEELLSHAACRILFRYAGMGNEEACASWNEDAAEQCARGKKQAARLMQKYPESIWMIMAEAQEKDLPDAGKEQLVRVPLLTSVEERSRWLIPEDYRLHELLDRKTKNFLCIGDAVPFRRYETVLKAAAILAACGDDDFVLRIAGGRVPEFEKYELLLRRMLPEYGLVKKVVFEDPADLEKTAADLMGSDLLIDWGDDISSASADAQFFRLPVLFRDLPEKRELFGEKQMYLADRPEEIAAALSLLGRNPETRYFIGDCGKENFDQCLSLKVTGEIFLEAVGKAAGEKE